MTRLRFACMAAACAAVLLAWSPRASAESVSLAFDKSVNGGVNLDPNNPNSNYVQPGPFYWHDSGTPLNGNFPPPTATFCLNPAGPLPPSGSSAIFSVETVAADLGASKANLITELYGNYYNTAWSSSSFTGSADSQAFQVALWQLSLNGNTTIGNTLGSYTVDPVNSSVAAGAQVMLNNLNGGLANFNTKFGNESLVALVSNDPKGVFQNQITLQPSSAVPAPPGVVLAGIGFLGLIGRSRWLRRKQAAV